MNDMRERMIEVLKSERGCTNELKHCIWCNQIAKCETTAAALLAAGCVMPRFKVGQEVYALGGTKWEIEEVAPVVRYGMTEASTCYFSEKEVYATLAEAQAALTKL